MLVSGRPLNLSRTFMFLSIACNHSQDISDKLQFSCEMAHYGKSSISDTKIVQKKVILKGSGASEKQETVSRGIHSQDI